MLIFTKDMILSYGLISSFRVKLVNGDNNILSEWSEVSEQLSYSDLVSSFNYIVICNSLNQIAQMFLLAI